MTETILSGIICCGLVVMGAMLSFMMAVTIWSDFQDQRDKRRNKK